MAKCININYPDFDRLVEASGLHPAILSAKMGVWMEQNNTEEWPTLEQLGLVESGITRMYRAELPILPDEGTLPDWVEEQEDFQKTKEATGRWFYKTLEEAEEFGRDFGPAVGGSPITITYVDIPTADIEKYNAAVNPEAHQFQGGPGIINEYFLPKELADNRKPLVQVKNGVDFVFEQTPELSNIGTKEQYSNYLDTIFPDSKVKDIVYHGTRGYNKITGKELPKFEKFDKIFIGKGQGLRSDDMAKGFYFGSYKIADRVGTRIIPAILNIKEENNTTVRRNTEDFDTKGDVFVVFEPEQIHILGSKQDIEGFKTYINKKDIILSKQSSRANQFDIISTEITNAKSYKDVAKLLYGYANALNKKLTNGHIEIKGYLDADVLASNVAMVEGLAKAVNRIIPGLLEVKPYRQYYYSAEDTKKLYPKRDKFNNIIVRSIGYRLAIHQSALDEYHNVKTGQNLEEGQVPDTVVTETGKVTVDFSDTISITDTTEYSTDLDPTMEGRMSPTLVKQMSIESKEVDKFLITHTTSGNIIDVLHDLKAKYGMSVSNEDILNLIKNNPEFNNIDFKVVNRIDVHTMDPDIFKKVKNSEGFIHSDVKNNKTTIYIIRDNINVFGVSNFDYLTRVLLHEAIHAITMDAINNPLTEQQKILKRELNSIFLAAKAKSKLAAAGHPAFKRLEEFIADGLTDAEVLQELYESEYNFFDRIWNAILKFFGLTPKTTEGRIYKNLITLLSKYNTIKVDRRIPSIYKKETYKGMNAEFNKYLVDLIEGSERLQNTIPDLTKVIWSSVKVNNKEFNPLNNVTHLPAENAISVLNLGDVSSNLDKDIKEFDKNTVLNKMYSGSNAIENGILDFKGRYNLTDRSKKELINKFKTMFGSDANIITNVPVYDNVSKMFDIIDFIVVYKDPSSGMIVYSIINLQDGKGNMSKFNTLKRVNKKDPNAVVFRPGSMHERTRLRLHLDTFMLAGAVDPDSRHKVIADRRYIISIAETSDGQYDLDREYRKSFIHELKWWSYYITMLWAAEYQKDRAAYLEEEVEEQEKTLEIRSDAAYREYKELMTAETGVSDIDKILFEVLKKLQSRKKIETMYGNRFRADEAANALTTIVTKYNNKENDGGPVEAMNHFINYAGNLLSEAREEIKKSWSKDVSADKMKLTRYYNMLGSFEILRHYKQYLVNIPDNKFEGDIQPDKNKLRQAVEDMDYIADQYKDRAIKLLTEVLAPYYNRIKIDHIDMLQREYRLNKYRYDHDIETTKIFNPEMTIDEYVYAQMHVSTIKRAIEDETKLAISSELKLGAKDIGYIEMLVDNILDTGDAVIGSFVKMIGMTDDKIRLAIEDKRLEYLPLVKEFEQYLNSTGKVFTNYEQMFDFMLEKNYEGKKTGYIISKFPSELIKERMQMVVASKDILDEKYRRQFVNNWIRDNMPLDKDAYLDALYDYLEGLTKLPKEDPNHITAKDYNALTTLVNEKDLFPTSTLEKSVKEGTLTEEVINIYKKWTDKYSDDFRIAGPEWDTEQWDKLQEILKDPNDIRTKIYNAISEIQRDADNMIPKSLGIGSRLPGCIKQKNERLSEHQNPFTLLSQSLNRTFTFTVDDTFRPQEIVDENGEALYWIPMHHSKPVMKENEDGEYEFDDDNQSYDLFGIYFSYYSSAVQYKEKYNILAEVSMFRNIIKQREVIKRDSFGTVIKNKIDVLTGISDNDEEKAVKIGGNISNMLESWINAVFYGKFEEKAGVIPGTNIDINKVVQLIKKYTAANLLGLNITQGIANVSLGEINQWIEAICHQYMSVTSYLKAHKVYFENMPGMIGDLGSRNPSNFVTLLAQHFDITATPDPRRIGKPTKVGDLTLDDMLHSTSSAGEHFMRVKLLIGMLYDKKAYNKQGEVIGSIMDFYSEVDGKLVFDPENRVDLERSEWFEMDRMNFKQRVEGVMSRIHGDYSNLAVVMMQQNAFLSMAYMFRKFMAPGIRRHWGKKRWEERTMEYQTGIYPTIYKEVIKPLFQLLTWWRRTEEELETLKQYTLGERWAMLSDQERANIIRGLLEIVSISLIMVMLRLIDDDDEEMTYADNFLIYQLLRLKSELMFYISVPQALKILRSPMASISVIENVSTLAKQALNPLETYERGPWKGQLKLYKDFVNMVPVMRQVYRLKNIDTQIPWFKR